MEIKKIILQCIMLGAMHFGCCASEHQGVNWNSLRSLEKYQCLLGLEYNHLLDLMESKQLDKKDKETNKRLDWLEQEDLKCTAQMTILKEAKKERYKRKEAIALRLKTEGTLEEVKRED